jgi:hypothetical protein
METAGRYKTLGLVGVTLQGLGMEIGSRYILMAGVTFPGVEVIFRGTF